MVLAVVGRVPTVRPMQGTGGGSLCRAALCPVHKPLAHLDALHKVVAA